MLKNSQQIIGNLGKDPEIRETGTGKKVASFPVAVSEKYKDQENTTWFNCVAWEKTAEIIEKYLKKGSKVAIEGRTAFRTYEDKDGQTRYVTELVVNELLMLGDNAPRKETSEKPQAEKSDSQEEPDYLPF